MQTTPTEPSDAPPGRRRGPRAQDGNARQAILAAAREVFAEEGYTGASLRAMASRADVDVSLISYYFDGKDDLFLQAIELPANPKEILEAALGADLEVPGEALTRGVLSAWEAKYQTAIRGVIQSALVRQSPWRAIQEYWSTQIISRLSARLPGSDAAYRAGLASAALASVALARHVVGVEAIVATDLEKLIADVARTVQGYLTGELT